MPLELVPTAGGPDVLVALSLLDVSVIVGLVGFVLGLRRSERFELLVHPEHATRVRETIEIKVRDVVLCFRFNSGGHASETSLALSST
jgi:hypothetical protein